MVIWDFGKIPGGVIFRPVSTLQSRNFPQCVRVLAVFVVASAALVMLSRLIAVTIARSNSSRLTKWLTRRSKDVGRDHLAQCPAPLYSPRRKGAGTAASEAAGRPGASGPRQCNLIQTLLEHGLIDECRLLTLPARAQARPETDLGGQARHPHFRPPSAVHRPQTRGTLTEHYTFASRLFVRPEDGVRGFAAQTDIR